MKRSRIDELIMRQEGLPVLDREALERVQLEKLNALLKRERERGGFYAALPERLDALGQLRELPFTTDEQLAEHGGAMLLCSQSEVERVLSDATSGTTGRAKRVFYTRGDCEHTVQLFAAGLGEFVFPGSVTMICMPFSGPFGLGELICEAIERLGARPLRLGTGLSYAELAGVLERERPDSYVGMAVPLLSMLRVCGRGSLRRALVSGDACPETVTAECEKILGSRLFPHYGSREMGLGGAICCEAHEGMHLRENHVIAEIIGEDGDVLPRGGYGELVITTIGMEAQPLIRYRTGDYTRILPDPCPCGSKVIRLDALRRKGEAGDMAQLDGRMFALPGLVDFVACCDGGGISVRALHDGSLTVEELRSVCPELIRAELRKAAPEDRAMYRGKRRIENTAQAYPINASKHKLW